jgi:GAF domain-containing protein
VSAAGPTLDGQPWAGALAAVERILNREPETDDALRQVVAALHERVAHYTWLGLFFVEGDELVLGPQHGADPSDRPRLPLAEGAVGRAAARGACELLNDVAAEPGHVPRFAWTRAEIAAAVVYRGQVVAVLAIDSDAQGPFGAADELFLARVATLISAHCLVGWDTGGVPWDEIR